MIMSLCMSPGLVNHLAHIIANEASVNIKITSGLRLKKEYPSIIQICKRMMYFYREIHRLKPVVEESYIRQWKILELIYPIGEDHPPEYAH